MKPATLALAATLSAITCQAGAADATSPIDYTQRNGALTPAPTPGKKILIEITRFFIHRFPLIIFRYS
jgi:hypothetical protein